MNYLCFEGLFRTTFIYFDLNVNTDYMADSLFYKREIPVKFKKEYCRDGDRYRVITCSVRNKYTPLVKEALDKLTIKMNLLGYTDYEQFAAETIRMIGGKDK